MCCVGKFEHPSCKAGSEEDYVNNTSNKFYDATTVKLLDRTTEITPLIALTIKVIVLLKYPTPKALIHKLYFHTVRYHP